MPSPMIAAVVGSAVGASKWHLGLINSAGPRFILDVLGVRVVANNTAAVTGLAPTFILRRVSAISGGSAVVFRKTDKLDLDAPTGVLSLSNPTTTAENTPELASVVVSTEETQAAAAAPSLWPPDGLPSIPITLNNGDGLAIQQSALASAGAVDCYIYFLPRRRTG